MEIRGPQGVLALHIAHPPRETCLLNPGSIFSDDPQNSVKSLAGLMQTIKDTSDSLARASRVAKKFNALQTSSFQEFQAELDKKTSQISAEHKEDIIPLCEMLKQKHLEFAKVCQSYQMMKESAKNEIVSLRQKNQDLGEKLESEASQSDLLRREIDNTQLERDSVASTAEELRLALNRKHLELESAKQHVEELQWQNRSLTTRLLKYRVECESVQKSALSLAHDSGQSRNELNLLHRGFQEEQRSHKRVEDELHVLRSNLRDQTEQLKKVGLELTTKQKEFALLDQRHENLVERHKDVEERLMQSLASRAIMPGPDAGAALGGAKKAGWPVATRQHIASGRSTTAKVEDPDVALREDEVHPNLTDEREGGSLSREWNREGSLGRMARKSDGELRRRLAEARTGLGRFPKR